MFYRASSVSHLWHSMVRVSHAAASGTAGVDVCALHHQPMLSIEYSRTNLLGKISAGNFFFFAREEPLNDSHPLFLQTCP